MPGGIFISYRRDDSRDVAGRLVDHLRNTFSSKDLFLDVDTVTPGARFDQVLSERVSRCAVMLAIIGPQWLTVKDKDGRRRIDSPGDYVRSEVAAALARGVPVIPVLVSGADLPDPADLPDDLKGLVMRQKVDLRYERFNADADALVASLARIVRRRPTRLPLATIAIAGAALAAVSVAGLLMTRPAGTGQTAGPERAAGTGAGAVKAVELCTEASEVTARLASTTDPETWRASAARFWELYNGPLYTVETAQKQRAKDNISVLEAAMVGYGMLIPQGAPPGDLPRADLAMPSLRVGEACTEVFDFYGAK
jgi:hypothetical protein